MKKRRHETSEERRKDRVEINLLAEEESGGRALAKATRGCTLPFLVALLVLGAGLEVIHTVLS